jgi:hypothetical protein
VLAEDLHAVADDLSPSLHQRQVVAFVEHPTSRAPAETKHVGAAARFTAHVGGDRREILDDWLVIGRQRYGRGRALNLRPRIIREVQPKDFAAMTQVA